MKNNAGRCEIEGFSSPELIALTMTGDGCVMLLNCDVSSKTYSLH